MTDFVGTSGDNTFIGGPGYDTFDLTQGGHDTAVGGDGGDSFFMGATFDTHDSIDGGAGSDSIYLEGDYDLTLTATMMANVEFLQMYGNHNYKIVTTDATLGDYASLSVYAGSDAAHRVIFDGSAETNGNFTVYSGYGNDILTGGGGGDFFSASEGDNHLSGNGGNDVLIDGSGHNTVSGGDGADTIYSRGHDAIDGGAGDDLLYLQFSGTQHNLTLHITDAAAPAVLSGQGSTIVNVERFWIEAGSGNDNITLGKGSDRIYGGGGNNTLHGGDGDDVILEDDQYNAPHSAVNKLYGDSGNDNLHGTRGGSNVLSGGAGNDVIFSYGTDKIVGGSGFDRITIDRAQSSADLTFHETDTALVTKLVGDGTTVSGVEAISIVGGYGDDNLSTLDGNDSLRGGEGNNILHGGAGDDQLSQVQTYGSNALFGGDGADQLSGSFGSNVLNGGTGNDTIGSYGGHDTIDGGDGQDTLTFQLTTGFSTALTIQVTSVSAVTTIGGNGSTFTGIETFNLYGGTGNDTFVTAAGDDFLSGDQGDNVLRGEGGNDFLTVQLMSGSNTLDGGSGNDTLVGANTGGVLLGGDGRDFINSYASDKIDGGAGDDNIYATGHADIQGGSGNDLIQMDSSGKIDGGSGTDTAALLRWASQADLSFEMTSFSSVTTLVGSGTKVTNVENIDLTGGAGNDTFTTLGGRDILSGGEGDNVLNGGGGDDYLNEADATGNNILNGGSGDDTIYTGRGHDTVSGGDGRDIIDATRGGAATIDGGAGRDFAILGSGGDTIGLTFNQTSRASVATLVGVGTSVVNVENLQINGGSGNDHFSMGNGDDILVGNGGDDVLSGGGGRDTAVFSAYTGVVADLASGHATGEGNDTLIGIENVTGTSGGDVIIGNDKANTLDGGSSGHDTLTGGAGDDMLISAPHSFFHFPNFEVYLASIMDGGSGNDTALIVRADATYNLTFDFAGADRVTTLQGDGTTVTGVENIQITAGYGNDSLTAGGGDDVLNGGWGDDVLKAGGGTNTLIGGAGADRLYGGAGSDTFVYAAGSDSTAHSGQFDTIAQFDVTQDRLAMPASISAVDAPIMVGTLSAATFDTDLAAALPDLEKHHAVLISADHGSFAHQTFLVVDLNGEAGFQADFDLVLRIRLDHGTNLSVDNFV